MAEVKKVTIQFKPEELQELVNIVGDAIVQEVRDYPCMEVSDVIDEDVANVFNTLVDVSHHYYFFSKSTNASKRFDYAEDLVKAVREEMESNKKDEETGS